MKLKINRNFLFKLLIIYCTIYAIGAITAPLLAKFGFYEISAKIYYYLSYTCHQNPNRSFLFFGYPFAVCARCFGFYIGFIFSNFFKLKFSFVFFIFLLALTDVFLNYYLSVNTGNLTRFISGIILGLFFNTCINLFIKKER